MSCRLMRIFVALFVVGTLGRSHGDAADSTAIGQIHALYQSLVALKSEGSPLPLAPSQLAHHDLSVTLASGRMTRIQLAVPNLSEMDSLAAYWIEAPIGIHMTPHLPMEKERLKDLTGSSELTRSPSACLLIAELRVTSELRGGADSLSVHFDNRSAASSLGALRRVLSTLHQSDPYVIEEAVRSVVHATDGRFFLMFWPFEGGWEAYLFNPHEREEISLFRIARDGVVTPMARYSMYADTTYFLLAGVSRPEIRPIHYDLSVQLDSHDRVQIVGTLAIVSDRAGLRLFRYRLDPRLRATHLMIANHQTAPLHLERSAVGDQVLLLDPPAQFGDTLLLSFELSGILRNENGQFDAGSRWYPQVGFGERATFALSVLAPKPDSIVLPGVSGSTVMMQPSNASANRTLAAAKGVVAGTSSISLPVPYLSFGAGRFRRYVGHSTASEHSATGLQLQGDSVLVYLNTTSNVPAIDSSFAMEPQNGADDLARCWSFFQERLGPLPWSQLQVHDLFDWHGRSYPGLVQIGWHTFYPSDPPGYNSQFRAHEVAHQWFGVAVGFDSYHDVWLSEGIAEYLGLCYLESYYGEDIFRGWLDEYRRGLLTIRDNERNSGEAPGALALGYRTATEERQSDYDLVVYRKGAWVVHMLRELLTDPNTGNDDRFWQMLREFYDRYRGRKATTRDLQFLAEKFSGADLDWFFRQWLYGNAIPHFKLEWKQESESADSGAQKGYLLSLDVRQIETESEFRSWLPVRVEYADKTSHDFHLFMSSNAQLYQLPPSKSRPVRVRLDPNVTLLARF